MKPINNREVERRTYIKYIVKVKGDEEVFFGRKGEAGSVPILEKKLEEKWGAFSEIYDCWEDGQMFYEIDSYFYTVETLDALVDDTEKENEFKQKLIEIITSMGLEVVSIEGRFWSQSKETLREIEEEKDARLRRELGICR